jgi:hypothetical protein
MQKFSLILKKKRRSVLEFKRKTVDEILNFDYILFNCIQKFLQRNIKLGLFDKKNSFKNI